MIQRPNPAEGMREVAHAFDTAKRLVEETTHHQAEAKAHSDYLQTSLKAERTFLEKTQGLQGKDEAEVSKGLNDIINKDFIPSV